MDGLFRMVKDSQRIAAERKEARLLERERALLDQFAGQAMAAFIDTKPHHTSPETIAFLAYQQAKAMMAERERYRT